MYYYKSPYDISQYKIPFLKTKPSKAVLDFIPGHYCLFNREFARKETVATAIILTEFLLLDEFYQDELIRHHKYGENWFRAPVEFVTLRTCILRKEQETSVDKLIALRFVDQAIFGLPAMRHIRINKDIIKEYFESNKGT